MRNYFLTTLLLLLSLNVFGQSKFSASYSVGFPTGETSDFFDSTSWIGFNIDYHYFIKEELAIGFSTGWQVFNENIGFVTETMGTETISGIRYNYLNSVPVLVTGSYYFSADKSFSPYASLGIGLVYNKLDEDTGIFRTENNGWTFSVRPEIGVDFEIGYNLAIRSALKYNYAGSGNKLPSLSYATFNIGLVWTN